MERPKMLCYFFKAKLDLGKDYETRFPGDDQAWSPCNPNSDTSNTDHSGD
jgi:hypothetical protein